MRVGFWLCIVIGAAVVIRRIVALWAPAENAPPQMAGLDAAFSSHAVLTLAHIVPALVFVGLLPFACFHRFASARWLERALFSLGFVVSITAYAMSRYAVGGWVERSAVLFFNMLFLYSLLRAFLYARQGASGQKQRWMARAVAILLGVATTRPVMGVFFATGPFTRLTPHQFFGIAFWIGWSINTLAIEIWLRSKKSAFLSA
jgi:hypothetical protein